MDDRPITSRKVRPPDGPYSSAVERGSAVYFSAQIPTDAAGLVSTGSAAEQARLALDNLRELLSAAALPVRAIVKTTVYLTDMRDLEAVDAVYGEYFDEPYPARSTIQVAGLPHGEKVQIEAVALRA